MKLHESAPPLLGPALGVQKPVIKKKGGVVQM